MISLKRKLLAVAMTAFFAAGAFGQRNGDKRPPKNPDTKVVVTPKEKEKPPSNNNSDKRNDGKKGKP